MHRRALLSAALALLVTAGAPKIASAQTPASAQSGLGITNLIKSVDVVSGQFVATTVQGQKIPLNLSASPSANRGKSCPILNLSLGPIDLNLLGLAVNTSQICLAVSAERGSGNLLGNLLCEVA